MRVTYQAPVRRGEKVSYEEIVVWIDEIPPEYQRGRHKEMKSRAWKREYHERSYR